MKLKYGTLELLKLEDGGLLIAIDNLALQEEGASDYSTVEPTPKQARLIASKLLKWADKKSRK